MSRRIDPEAMWAHAWEMLSQAERMHRQFFRLASSPRARAVWEPPADVFESAADVLVVVAMPGVPAEAVQFGFEGSTLVVRGERPFPLSVSRHAVRQLELPYGYFERRITLPAGALELASHELAHGCLVLRLRRLG